MTKLPVQRNISDDHLTAIGLFIATWAALETHLSMALTLLMGAPEPEDAESPALIVVHGMAAQTTLGAIGALIAEFRAGDHEWFRDFDDKVGSLSRKRNLFAHGMWECGRTADRIHSLSAKTVGGLNPSKESFTAHDIRLLAQQTAEASDELLAYLERRGLLRPRQP